ncbi:helix-turn-helix transcriptional regulator [Pedobacter panaciterrae]|uniref:helix-turn-helix transcriptional regulator n=1 Tax=Pedobacter panaciterrae TaxID=363849 RepID=UPI00155DCCCC|nr:helix-turn-helix transcriptional regulator [Pedobacter panaciterrae]NQX54424.1 helix-turn-helix transcriptional regulator [Pedobacter panaciterrae]
MTQELVKETPVADWAQRGYVLDEIKLLFRLQRLIETDFRKCKYREYYAALMGTSLYQLDKMGKAHLGMTVYQMIQDRLFQEALKLLRDGKDSVKEITFELGFRDQAYFARFIKRRTRLSPMEIRNLAGTEG